MKNLSEITKTKKKNRFMVNIDAFGTENDTAQLYLLSATMPTYAKHTIDKWIPIQVKYYEGTEFSIYKEVVNLINKGNFEFTTSIKLLDEKGKVIQTIELRRCSIDECLSEPDLLTYKTEEPEEVDKPFITRITISYKDCEVI